MSTGLTPARMVRLCLKELRESLRDRRTIVTLVLMPLLVYPLLSLILNRVLLTNMRPSSEPSVTIGIAQELKDSSVQSVLQMGYTLLNSRQYAPVYVEDTVYDRDSGRAAESQVQLALPRPQVLVLEDSGREALRNLSVDVVLTRKSQNGSDDEEGENNVKAAEMSSGESSKRKLEQLEPTGEVPEKIDYGAFRNVIGSYDIRYRHNDQQSERALQFVERAFAAVNNEASRELIRFSYSVPFRLQATPVVMKSNYSDLLATMVPLVLVLMTMAGAVYPAIDLTAGERERGTMEALIVSPIPTSALLIAKYAAVVTVALLTALANLAAMTITLWVSGISQMIFGEGVLSFGVVGTVLALLVLFTMFFAALLLAVTSFAKSFKEAQAYLIPLMLLALTPGVMSLLPGIRFSVLFATIPLVNIVLLARQVLVGGAEWEVAVVAVACNCLYAMAALALASRLFGSDASMHGSQGSWRDLLSQPRETSRFPRVDQMMMTMAGMFPLYFVASSLLPRLSNDFETRLWSSAAVSYGLILCLPLWVCWFRRIQFRTTFRLGLPPLKTLPIVLPAVLLIGASAWMVAHEIVLAGQSVGLGTIDLEQMERVLETSFELRRLPIWMVLFIFAVTPAVCEEFLFRGFVLSSLGRKSALWAIVISSVVFGMMHVLTSNVLAVERFLPSTFMGLILGWVALRTGSIWPGMLLHAIHNGLLLAVSHYQDQLKEAGFFVEERSHLPIHWLLSGAAMLAIGFFFVWLSGRVGQGSIPVDTASSVVEEA